MLSPPSLNHRWSRSLILIAFAALAVTAIHRLHQPHWASFLVFGAYPDREPGVGEQLLYGLFLSFGVPAALALAMAAPPFVPLRHKLVHNLGMHRLPPRAWMALAGGVAMLGAWCVARFVTDYSWFTDDEQAYIYQAKLYRDWQLAGRVMEPVEVFSHSFVVEVAPEGPNGELRRWTGVYPVLQPFLMALSSRLGSMNLSQFLCVGLVVYHTGRLAQTLFGDHKLGITASWLCAASPMLLGLGSTYHTAVLATTLTVVAMRLLLWTLSTGNLLRGILLGLTTGSIFLARPMEGTLCVLVFASVLALRAWRTGKQGNGTPARWFASLEPLVGYGLGGLIPLAVFLVVNVSLTGHPLRSAYTVLEDSIGGFFWFGENKMWGRNHTVALGVRQTWGALVRMNAWLFAWPASLALWALSLHPRFRHPRARWLLALSVLQLIGYFPLAFGSVHDFGSAYHVWHLPWVASISAWVLWRLVQHFEQRWGAPARAWPLRAAVAMSLVGLAAFWPIEMRRWRAVSDTILGPVRAAKAAIGEQKGLVFIPHYHPAAIPRTWVYRPPAPHPGDQILWGTYYPGLVERVQSLYPERRLFALVWQGEMPTVLPIEPAPTLAPTPVPQLQPKPPHVAAVPKAPSVPKAPPVPIPPPVPKASSVPKPPPAPSR